MPNYNYSILKKLFTRPPHKTFKKAIDRFQRKRRDRKLKAADLISNTRAISDFPEIKYSYVRMDELDLSGLDLNVSEYLVKMYLGHRFDLLGSGWIKNSLDSPAFGLEGYKYDMNIQISRYDSAGNWLKEMLLPPHDEGAKKIWNNIDSSYTPIDWQKDVKSGFRWSEKRWYKDQFTGQPGADIKVPWELARFQHLPQMAMFADILPAHKDALIKEFKNQVLDFIALNPPRMGVNWTCTMDVGIRAANLLIAYDLFCQIDCDGAHIDDTFKKIFAQSIYEHGLHIVANLEWSEELATNHYLSNIAGLLFIAVYLDNANETVTWLAFAIQEIITEFKRQFYPDGSNFESSTSYHRLSTELILYSAALILGLNNDKKNGLKNYDYRLWKGRPELKPLPDKEYKIEDAIVFPDWFIDRLYRAGKFTADLTKPTGEIPQIGDNDSGRFFKLSPNGRFLTGEQAKSKYMNLKNYESPEQKYWDENILNHQTMLSAWSRLFEYNTKTRAGNDFPLEKSFIDSLSRGKRFEYKPSDENTAVPTLDTISNANQNLQHKKETVLKPPKDSDISLKRNLQFKSYHNSGIFIFKSDRVHLTISATPIGQDGLGGHSHNDELSFELNIDGDDLIVDPGTYLYTPMPEIRNRFRSVKAHNSIIIDNQEQNRWYNGAAGLFSLQNECRTDFLEAIENSLTLRTKFREIEHVRQFIIEDDRIVIYDYCNHEFKVNLNKFNTYSNGYGKLISMNM